MADTPTDTSAAVAQAQAALDKAKAADADAAKKALENRAPEQAMRDLLAKVVNKLGNIPEMEADLKLILKEAAGRGTGRDRGT